MARLRLATPALLTFCARRFLGDELCCSGVPFANLSNVAQFAKDRMKQYGGGLVYTNECIRPVNDSFAGHIFYIPHVPDAIDLFSIE